MRLSSVVQRPITTEKSVDRIGRNVFTFRVNKKASKGSIREVVERMFGVDVVEVKTMLMPGKKRRMRGTKKAIFARTQVWKKALVSVKEGQKIGIFSEGGK
ncbi:50S ribosomal protein L23 [candidate division WWE3 bacterium]|nr:50S ribosomal protein L23 [candidate division WWE3 bacterium]